MRPITFELSGKIHSLQQPWVKNLFLFGSKMSFISTTEKGTQLGSFLYNVLGKDKKSFNNSFCDASITCIDGSTRSSRYEFFLLASIHLRREVEWCQEAFRSKNISDRDTSPIKKRARIDIQPHFENQFLCKM